MQRYINNSIYSVDNFLQGDQWLYRIKINDYQLINILWNLFLILIPFIIGFILIRYWERTGFETFSQKLFGTALAFFWLLFIPNTAYVISEVRHLIDYCPSDSPFRVCEQNAWIPLFFFIYSAIGWISFVYLVNQMKYLVRNVMGSIVSHIFPILIMPLIALGFLLGLINRWNSWEIFTEPLKLYQNIVLYLNEPAHFTNLLIFTTFLYILYFTGNLIFKDRYN